MKAINKLVIVYAVLLTLSALFLAINFTPKSKTNISITSSTLASSPSVQQTTVEAYNVKFEK